MYPDFFDSAKLVAQYDPEVADAMDLELGRQRRNIELIASENFVSPAVMAAMGSVLTNKYAEGYPGKRYYGGCEYVDIVENLAIERAKELFGADCANVQPHSGAQANMAAYSALINPGDTVMGMSLAHRQRSLPEAYRRGRIRLSACYRLRAHRRYSKIGRRIFHGRHGAHRGTRRGGTSSLARALCRRCHNNHA